MHKILENKQKIIEKHQKMPVFFPPLVEVSLYNNRLEIEWIDKQGNANKTEHIPTENFSNRRMILADFETGENQFRKALLPFKSRLFFFNAYAIINVKENLIDGLTMNEWRAIKEAFERTGCLQSIVVLYLGKELYF